MSRRNRPSGPSIPQGRTQPSAPARASAPRPPRDSSLALLYGYHAVRAALRAPRRVLIRLVATDSAAERLGPEIAARGVPVVIASSADITARVGADAVHQGVLLEARPLETATLDDIPDDGIVLALDQVTDPHNVGAILRSAAAYALDAVITTERHAPAMTGVLAKAASGALDLVPLVSIVNLARALDELGDRGFQCVGLDSEATHSLATLPVSAPLVLVLGAEGKGLRRLTRERCDALARLDLPGPIKSLNVSNACAVALTHVRSKLPAR